MAGSSLSASIIGASRARNWRGSHRVGTETYGSHSCGNPARIAAAVSASGHPANTLRKGASPVPACGFLQKLDGP